MRVLIRTWTRQGGERSAQDRSLDVEKLRIGRSTDQDIELADLRVALTAAEIVRDTRGHFTIQSKNAQTIWLNENPVDRERIEVGNTIDCGRYRLTIAEPPPGVDLLVEIDERVSAREEKTQRLAGLMTSLGAAGLSRRRLSWLLFIAVLLPGLLLPAWYRFGIHAADKKVPAFAWPTDHVWVPGPSSPSHAFFQNDCGRCHQVPFRHVQNEACLDCHKNLHAHADDAHWASLPVFAQASCEDCHREHAGDMLVDRHNALCTQCHAKPQQQFAGIDMEAAADFSEHHPALTPRVSRFDIGTGKFRWIEASPAQPAEWHNETNFIYPHDKHLDPKGIKSPTGKRVLKCADCHEPDSSGVSFKPVDMKQHCSECHRLDFDPDDPDRTVPHGDSALVAQTIRDYYGRAALAGGVTKPDAPEIVKLVRKPGEQLTKPQAQIALAWADQQSALVIDEVFDKRICGYCHVVKHTDDATVPFSIAPIALQDHGPVFTHARFSHAAHSTEKCSSCHAAETSKHSEDVLMPDIKRCRDCHGDVGSSTRIASPCSECHGYHIAQQRTMDKPAIAVATPATEVKP
jgi:predicted CXXCH cytochrome family protein